MQAGMPVGTQRHILDRLKRRGEASIPDLAVELELSPETIRSHIRTLSSEGLVCLTGTRRSGPGRPEGMYALTEGAEALFPRREGELLRELAAFLRSEGEEALLATFLDRFADRRRDAALVRLDGLEGRARLDEVATILTEEGYMAEVVEGASGGQPRLRLCHCPLRELVHVSHAPCKAEIGFVRSLVGGPLTRVEYLPDGDGACAYAIGEEGVS